MLIQKIQVEKVIKLSPAWVSLFEFVQEHPFIKFERLEFYNGEPRLGTTEIKMVESHKF